MDFIAIPAEQTTAVTDAVLAVMAMASALYLARISPQNSWKARLWVWFFGLLALAFLLGVVVHGFKLSKVIQAYLWQPLYLVLGLVGAIFMIAALHDMWGEAMARRALPIMVVAGVGFFGITVVWPAGFRVFIIYEVAIMLLALGAYLWLAYGGQLEGAWLMAGGILVTIIAAWVQASNGIAFTFIWSFDHNGAYHLIQMVGIVLLVVALRKGLLSRD